MGVMTRSGTSFEVREGALAFFSMRSMDVFVLPAGFWGSYSCMFGKKDRHENHFVASGVLYGIQSIPQPKEEASLRIDILNVTSAVQRSVHKDLSGSVRQRCPPAPSLPPHFLPPTPADIPTAELRVVMPAPSHSTSDYAPMARRSPPPHVQCRGPAPPARTSAHLDCLM